MLAQINRAAIRRRIRYRVRKKISGTAERPRLAVFRSQKHIYVQAIDDEGGRTLAHVSTQDKDVRAADPKGWDMAAAIRVGQAMAEKLKTAGVKTAILDRGGFTYHGRIAALTDALREGGVKL